MIKTAIFALILFVGMSGVGQANLEHPNDFYLHGGVMFVCGSVGHSIFSNASEKSNPWIAKHPTISTLILCNGIGLVKEFVWDDRGDYRDVFANEAGMVLGIGITYRW